MKRLPAFDKLFKHYQWALLSGVLVGTSYIPFPPWAVLFCWAPLWWSTLQTQSLKDIFKQAWVSQFVLTIIGFHWISYVSHEFGFMPWPVAIGVLLLFASAVHLYIPLAILAARWLGKKLNLSVPSQLILMATFHVLGEAYWPSLFSWNLGYTLYWGGFAAAQTADVFGFIGLSLFLHLINALLTWLWIKKDLQLSLISSGSLIFLIAALTFWGRTKQEHWKAADENLNVLLVQANIGNFEKVMAEKGQGFQHDISTRYFDLTRQALTQNGSVQLVVWPETAYPDYLGAHNDHRNHTKAFSNFVKEIGKPVMTGAYGNDPPGPPPRSEYNSLFLYTADGVASSEMYKKTNLLAFGEYTPLGDIFPVLKKYNPGGSGWGKGSGPITLNLGDLKLGPQICYDSLYDWFAVGSTKNGSQVLVNLTNDSWFGPRSEPEQHLFMTLARAVENRRPLIRSTNTGISTVALASGQVLDQSPIHQAWSQVYSVPYKKNPEMTFFTRFRYLFPLAFALLVVATLVLGRKKRV